MTEENAFDPLPALGDFVYCRFPEKLGEAGPKPRPCLVIGHVEFDDGGRGVLVAYGTTKRVTDLKSGEFQITKVDGEAYKLAGLSFDTKFDLGKTAKLPYTDKWFRIPENPRFGHTPKLGTLHSSLYRRAQAAHEAVSTPAPE